MGNENMDNPLNSHISVSPSGGCEKKARDRPNSVRVTVGENETHKIQGRTCTEY